MAKEPLEVADNGATVAARAAVTEAVRDSRVTSGPLVAEIPCRDGGSRARRPLACPVLQAGDDRRMETFHG
jgi:hypothetical protein